MDGLQCIAHRCDHPVWRQVPDAGDQLQPQRGADRNPVWWYRLGRLQLDEGQRAPALASLGKATTIGDEDPVGKAWVADAHRLTGDIYYAQNKRQESIVEYGRYLELADREAIDRADVEAKLRKMGEGLD